MKNSNQLITLAKTRISFLQNQIQTFRQTTYKAVHDDIGSTISAASIKSGLLINKLTDDYQRQQLSEIHTLIRDTMDKVTQLNKHLKVAWIPQGLETFFQSLSDEFSQIGNDFNIKVTFNTSGTNNMEKMSFLLTSTSHEWIKSYIHNSISRLVEQLTIVAIAKPNCLEWTFSDSADLPPETPYFDKLIKKTIEMGGNFQILKDQGENTSVLTLPIKSET